jgi:hypothetical protein
MEAFESLKTIFIPMFSVDILAYVFTIECGHNEPQSIEMLFELKEDPKALSVIEGKKKAFEAK